LQLGGTEQRIAKEALGDWLAKHRHDLQNGTAYGNNAHFVDSPHFIYLMQLDHDMRESEVYCRESGLDDTDDLVLSVIHRRKA
jgi:hypothetical protein